MAQKHGRLPANPILLFKKWLAEAQKAGIHNAESMALATSTRDGAPSARMVLYKGIYRGGFGFFTNYESRKSRELDTNPRAALVFHWDSFERQIRVEGRVERCTAAESNRYFASRARFSQLGAWASRQSETLSSRAELDERLVEIEARFARGKIPRPEFWGGYRVVPEQIEFWQGKQHRLHERTLYTRRGSKWKTSLLSP
jgi:pyridoxamine 5'-phosphate oxidase